MSRLPKDGVVALSRSILIFQFIDQAKPDELADRIEELAKAGHADGAVDVACLIPNRNLHTLVANGFFRSSFQIELAQKLPVKLGYLLADQYGRHFYVPHDSTLYVEKYARSVAA